MAKILIVDDEEHIRSLYSMELTEAGYEVITAENGHMLLERIEKEKPDLVVLDIKMVDYKGLDLLLEAFADIRFRDGKIKLIIAGEYYSDKKVYADLINKYSLEKDIIQIDNFIQDSEVKYFFSACDLVVQPYKSATQSGITQIAYHFNKPMVVTDVGGLSELCPDGKVGYVTSTNPDEIASAIIRFFLDTDQEEMINNIIEEKKKYSWGILIQNIFTLLDKIKHSQIEA